MLTSARTKWPPGPADTTGSRERRPRRRKGEPGDGVELDGGTTSGPSDAAAAAGTSASTGPANVPGSASPSGGRRGPRSEAAQTAAAQTQAEQPVAAETEAAQTDVTQTDVTQTGAQTGGPDRGAPERGGPDSNEQGPDGPGRRKRRPAEGPTARPKALLAGEARNGVTGRWDVTSWSSTSALRPRR